MGIPGEGNRSAAVDGDNVWVGAKGRVAGSTWACPIVAVALLVGKADGTAFGVIVKFGTRLSVGVEAAAALLTGMNRPSLKVTPFMSIDTITESNRLSPIDTNGTDHPTSAALGCFPSPMPTT
jgi:hypothetical protein